MPNQKQDTPVFDVGKAATRQESNRAHPFHTTYDTLNNLTTVSQGSQTRSFSYSSLSRLLSAANPESGTISYEYDNNGNLTEKIDARSITTEYTYDALNRVTFREYSDSTPEVTYTYDASGVAYSKGKLTKVTTGNVSSPFSITEYTEFDILGRVKKSKQTTDGTAYNVMEYTYNLSGALIEQKYPSGRIVKNTLSQDGDLAKVESKKNSSDYFRDYANSFVYTASGAISSMRLGNGKFETTQYNSRLQPVQIGLGHSTTNQDLLKLNYDYGTTDNNGNVKAQTITVNPSNQTPLVFNQTYTYDSLNRLKQATEMTGTTENWKQTYNFDRYGNRQFDTTNNNTTTLPQNFNADIYNPTINTANNRFTSGQGYTYDSSGNIITDAEGRSFTYDAENKQKEVENSSSQTIGQYFYDGDGKRVKKITNTEIVIFVYDAGGKLVAEYSTALSQTPQTQYLTNDHLGSPRINTNALANVVSRSDYMPYGEEIIGLGGRSSTDKYVADDVRQGFTGYLKDEETGLDFAQARMYKKELGRFTSTDPIIMDPKRAFDPQRINSYIYSRNNPLKYIDSDGEDIEEPTGLSEEDQANYEKWRDEFLSTDEGKATWKKYQNNKNFTLKITVADRGSKNKGAEVKDFVFDADGNFVGATMELGKNLGKGLPEVNEGYIVTGRLTTVDSAKIGAIKIAHEFGHLDEFMKMGKGFYEYRQIMDRRRDEALKPQTPKELSNNPRLKQFDEEFKAKYGVGFAQNDYNQEAKADINAIPTIRQLTGSIPYSAKKAVEKFQTPEQPPKSKKKP